MAGDVRDPESGDILIGEAEKVYCFDFSNETPVIAGAALSAPTAAITHGPPALLDLGSPAVNVGDFEELDEATGAATDLVLAGKGVSVPVTPGAVRGVCTVTVTALESIGGQRLARQRVFRVR